MIAVAQDKCRTGRQVRLQPQSSVKRKVQMGSPLVGHGLREVDESDGAREKGLNAVSRQGGDANAKGTRPHPVGSQAVVLEGRLL